MENSPNGNLELLSDKNSCLVLVDYQSSMFRDVVSEIRLSSGMQHIARQKQRAFLTYRTFCQ